MKKVDFTVYFCGITEGTFSERIMIYAAHDSYRKTYSIGEDIPEDGEVSDIIKAFKLDANSDNNPLAHLVDNSVRIDTAYLHINDTLYGFQYDKKLLDIFGDFDTEYLELAYFHAGGASLSYHGYQFVVHSDEKIHEHRPHVHVKRNGNATRYSLDTLTHFPEDAFCREFQRDEKKIIIPFLEKNIEKLSGYWDLAMKGYIPPVEDERGKQYYRES